MISWCSINQMTDNVCANLLTIWCLAQEKNDSKMALWSRRVPTSQHFWNQGCTLLKNEIKTCFVICSFGLTTLGTVLSITPSSIWSNWNTIDCSVQRVSQCILHYILTFPLKKKNHNQFDQESSFWSSLITVATFRLPVVAEPGNRESHFHCF